MFNFFFRPYVPGFRVRLQDDVPGFKMRPGPATPQDPDAGADTDAGFADRSGRVWRQTTGRRTWL
jgi:hypothetical protein